MSIIVDKVRPPKITVRARPVVSPKADRAPTSPTPVQAAPSAGDVGFLMQAAAGEQVNVCLLAWPLVPNGWPALAAHWRALKADREFSTAAAPVDGWVAALAPSLCAPFRDANAAESTIGAALARLPVGLAIGVADTGEDALLGCVDGYVTTAASEGRSPLRLIITECAGGQAMLQHAAGRSWRIGLLKDWHQRVTVNEWRDPQAPLPLELCRLIAQAAARKLAEPSRWNPIYDGAEAKIRSMPVALKNLQRRTKKS
ncbi:hypothetical protein [Ahniella affigens]|nr:hypothetical protein [Ahniella affigens]